MIEEVYGNVLDVPTGIIVHGCNCQGVMGSGIAAEVRERFPAAYQIYINTYQRQGLIPGDISFVEVAPFKVIVNANTQEFYGVGKRQVSYEAIARCFERVTKLARNLEYGGGITLEQETNPVKLGRKLDIVFPLIGADRGGGNWNIISAIIDNTVPDDYRKVLYRFKP